MEKTKARSFITYQLFTVKYLIRKFHRIMFIITCFLAQIFPRLRANMLFDLFFHIDSKPSFSDIDLFDCFDELFGPLGYEKDDFLYVTHLLKLDHFTDTFKFRYFDEVPTLIKKTVFRHAIYACINYHTKKIPLPDYKEFIAKETGFYHSKKNSL